MKKKTKKGTLLSCKLTRGGVLTIEIGVDSLAFAATHGPYADRADEARADGRFYVSNAKGFAADVVSELTYEAEDGSTLVTRMLDQACEQAIEQGSQFFVDTQEDV